MLATKDLKLSAEQLIELIKQLPESKQEFINGYVQGLSDKIAEQKKPA